MMGIRDELGLPELYLDDKSAPNAVWIAFMEVRRATVELHKQIHALHCLGP